MNKIEIKILNPEVISECEKMTVVSARLTQRGHNIKDMSDFMTLYDSSYKHTLTALLTELPHPTIQKFGVINVVVVGASRRFLAQITRHQNEVKFMSASLQYSNYSRLNEGTKGITENDFVVPYELLEDTKQARKLRESYLDSCLESMSEYSLLVNEDVDNDTAGYVAPQSLRNVLIISATPYQWKHMIGQRTCHRNTDETRYVMLKIWEELYRVSPVLFYYKTTGPQCLRYRCLEGQMRCKRNRVYRTGNPEDILKEDYPLLIKECVKNV